MKSTGLFDLIRSLKQTEKRYFKLYATAFRDNNLMLQLFDTIDRQKVYDKEAIKNRFQGKTFIKQFNVARLKLYKLILKSMRAYHAEKSVNARLVSLLQDVCFLYKHQLFEQCRSLLSKAEAIAVKYEKCITLQDIYKWKRKILDNTLMKGEYDYHKIAKALVRENEVLNKQQNINQYEMLYHQIYHRIISKGKVRDDKYIKEVKGFMESSLLKDQKKALSREAINYFLDIHKLDSLFSNELEKSLHYAEEIVKLYEAHPEMIEISPYEYLIVLSNVFSARSAMGKYEDLHVTLSKIQTVLNDEKYDFPKILKAKFTIVSYMNMMKAYMVNYDYDKVIELVPQIEENLSAYENKILSSFNFLLYYYIAYSYFVVEDHGKALDWLNKAQYETKENIREDIHCFIKIFNLIIHYELGNEDFLEYAVKSTYRFLYKKEKLYKVETAVLHFIRKQLPKINNQKQLIEAFKEFRDELVEIVRDPFEKKALEYFDLIAWAKSKIENRSFGKLVRENTKTNTLT